MNETEKVVAPSGKPLPSQVINAVRLGISRAEVQSIRVVDTDLVVILKNGKRIVIPDGAIKAMMDPAFTVAFKDTDVLGMSVIQSAGPLEINSISAASLSEAGNAPNTAVKGSEQGTTTGLTTGSAEVTPAVESKSSDATTAASRTLADMQADATSRNQISEPVSRGVTGRGLGSTPENSFNPSANSGVVSTVAEAAKTGGIFSSLDGLPPALGAVGALGALGALGATAGKTAAAIAATAATPTVVMDTTYTISGVVALGPFVQSVTIKAYDAKGTLLYTGNSDTSGRFTAKITSGYKGAILLLASDSNGTMADYIDEASGTSKSLGSSLIRSASVADGTQNVVVNVSPLTELVVRALGLSIDGISLANVTTAAITNANKTIGQQFGLSDASSDPIETVINSQGSSVAGNQYGKVLSAFSGLDNLSSSKELLSGLSADIVSAAAAVADNITTNSTSALSDAVAAVTKVNGAPVLSLVTALTVSEVANLNFTSPDMKVKVAYVWIASGDVVQFYDASGAKVHAAHTVTLAESQVGYVELTISAADFTTAVDNRSQSLKVSVLNAISSEVLSETSLPVLVDNVVPLAPVISASASQQNAIAAAAGAVSITAEADASVAVTFTDVGNHTVSKTITGNGSTPVVVALTTAELATLSSEGAMTVSARATDAIGNVSSSGTGSFTLDRIAPGLPTVVVTASQESAAIATAGAVNVAAEAGASVVVTFTDASNHTVLKTVTGNGSTPVVVALTAAELAVLSSEGTVTVSAKATDAAGNLGSAGSGSFILDRVVPVAPTVVVSANQENAATATAGAVNITAEVGASVAVTFTDVGNRTVTKTISGNGNTPVVVALTAADLTTLNNEGAVSVSAKATDAAGNVSSAGTGSFTLDRIVPVAPSVVATASQQNAIAAAAGAASITAEAGASVAVTFTDVGNHTVIKTITGNGSTPVVVALTTAELATLSSEGAVTVSARATDAAGNLGSAGTGSFTLDRVVPLAPTVAATASQQNVAIATAGAVNVTAEAGVRVAVTFTDAGNRTVTKTVTGNGSTPVVVALTTADLATLSSEGAVAVSAKAIDASGNESSASSGSFTFDRMAPGLPTVVASASKATAATATASAVSVTAETGASVVVTFTDAGNRTVTKTITGNGSTPVVIALTVADLTTLSSEGVITVLAKATDAVGNESSSATSSFILDRLAPTLANAALATSSVSGSNASFTNAPTPTYSVTAETGCTVRLVLNGVTYTATESNSTPGSYGFSFTSALAAGSYTPVVTVTDAAGNTVSASGAAFTVKTAIAALTSSNLDTASASSGNASVTNLKTPSYTVVEETGATVSVTINSKTYQATESLITPGSYTVTVPAGDALIPGNYTPSISVTDKAGNNAQHTGSAFSVVYLIEGGTGMAFTSVTSAVPDPTPADARTNQASGTVVFNYTGADLVLANGEKFQYSLDNVSWADVSSVNTDTNTVSIAGLSLTGSPTVRIRATDTWGSTTAVLAQQTITYDNVVATPSLPILPSTATDLTDSATGWLGSLNAPFNVSGTVNLTANSVAGNKYVTTPLLTMLPGKTYTVQFEVISGTTTPAYFGLTQETGKIASYNLPLGTQLPSNYSGITAGLYTVSVTNPFTTSTVYLSWGTNSASENATWTFDNVALSSGRYALAVQGLESGATWLYSLDTGATWLAGTGSSIDLPSGSTYNASTIFVKQTDLAGNVSTQAVNDKAITVTRALLTLSNDDGLSALDTLSTQGAITLGNLISTGATWEYTTNTGTTWVAGTGTSFTLANGEYLANTVQVRQTLGSLTTIVAANTTSAIRINANASLLLAELKTGGFNIVGASANEAMGNSVASAGDVNGDGLADIILGASLSDAIVIDAGRAYVVFGSTISNVALSAAALSTRGFIIEGESAGNNAGISVSSAGDINGDGLADLLVGANNANSTGTNKSGRTYVVYGKTNNDTVQLSSVAGGTGGFVVNGDGASQYTGWSVHSAGDVNGDGWSDLVIGARNWKDTSINIGRSFVVFGGPSMASVNLTTITAGTGGFAILGELANDQSGYSVASAGDVNGDGLADLIVSAPFADVAGPLVDAGRSYVVFGKTSTQSVNLGAVATGTGGFVINGQGASDESGYSVSAAGDVNGDGLADLIVGAWKSDPNGVLNAGRSYVVFGQTGTAAVNLSAVAAATGGFVINGSGASEQSVFSVSYAGDFNGDGLADLLVGARQTASASSANVAYLVLGKSDTTAVQLSDVARGVGGFGMSVPNSWDSAGTIVSAGGDINGDGLADLIVSAPGMNANVDDAGRTYVVFGNTTGINSLSAVDWMGTTGNDTRTSTGSQTLVGLAGNDTFTASGADVLRGGLGNDIFTIGITTATALQSAFGVGGNTSQLAQIDGGAGVDTLRLSGAISLDLTLVANQAGSTPEGGSRISSIERIDMAIDTSTNTLKLGLNDVLDMAGMNLFTTANGWTNATSTPLATTNARHQLVVDGTTADTVQIVGGASWTLAGTATSSVSGSSQTYNVWNHNSAAAQMLIDTDINRVVL